MIETVGDTGSMFWNLSQKQACGLTPLSFRERDWVRGIFEIASSHSGLMPASRITWPHFAISAVTNAPNSAGVDVTGSVPVAR